MTMDRIQIQVTRWLARGVICAAVVGATAIPACRHIPRIPLGTNNNIRMTNGVATSAWAEPMDERGLPNLHKVSDDLYRGAQPTAEGVERLKALGVRTIVSLRSSDTDKNLPIPLEITYEHIPMTAWRPNDRDVVRFLRIVGDENRLPVFVHCRRGADRTGMMVAIYRIAVQGWDKEQAIAEMTQGGFRFNSGWQNLVRYVRDLDIEAIRQQAGLGEPATAH